jgi:hypothetical protein
MLCTASVVAPIVCNSVVVLSAGGGVTTGGTTTTGFGGTFIGALGGGFFAGVLVAARIEGDEVLTDDSIVDGVITVRGPGSTGCAYPKREATDIKTPTNADPIAVPAPEKKESSEVIIGVCHKTRAPDRMPSF